MEKTYYALKATTPYGELFYDFRTMDLVEFNAECLTGVKTYAKSIHSDYTRHYPINIVTFILTQVSEEQMTRESDSGPKQPREVRS